MLTATRQLAASVLALTIALPAAADDLKPAVPMQEAKSAPGAKSAPAKSAPEPKAAPARPAPEARAAPAKPAAEAKPAPAKPAAESRPATASASEPASVPAGALDAPARNEPFIHGHRYAYVAGGVLLLGGVGFGYFSRGEAKRAESLETARESQAALSRSRTAAATSNLMYGMAGLTIAYGLLLEVLPEPAADAASLTYHF
ncbi:hypothetical protein [Hyalangium gracile]|uniref:hypothetical protein n=1 Tax=Hyalangium gracile TaxID=394092 RepID=UPI001CCC0CA1|nr:hypothetical protein [Hyalangium gracile]